MKKLLRNLALAFLPLVLYYGLFLAFEPNNFFGLRSTTPTGAVFGALRAYDKDPTQGVFIGDSRFANLGSLEDFTDGAGTPYTNLAFGGASLKENLDELEWLLEEYPVIDTVVFELSFYTLNLHYNADRWDFIEMALQNPFAYLTNLSYNLEAMQNLTFALQGLPLGGGEHETRDPATYEWTEWETPGGERVTIRGDIAAYFDSIAEGLAAWEANHEQYERLVALIKACAARDIVFVVVLPPLHDATYTYLLDDGHILPVMEELVAGLRETPALVLDYEISNRPAYPEDHYFDGLHLDYARGVPVWKQQLFGDIASGT